tara:strand:+ start:2852 stop:3553 length:702 start_codon:yes stop_codon:yes gene_type:complete
MIDKEVLVFSAARTGSTLIWQCLCRLFKTVHKSQDSKASLLLQQKLPCVITERNRVESFLSRERVVRFKDVSAKEYTGELNRYLDLYFLDPSSGLYGDTADYRLELYTIEYLKNYYKGKKLILQYEEFFNNYDYIFDQFESFFEFTIPVETKNLIAAETNLAANEKIQDKFKDFDSHCKESLIHGKHIISGEPDFYKSIISSENYSRLHNLLWENADYWKGLYKNQIKKDNAS